jgi:hypothetical protein
MAGESVIIRAGLGAVEAGGVLVRSLSSSTGLKTAAAVGVTGIALGYSAKTAAEGVGNGLLKAGVGLGLAYLVYRALKN